MGACSPQSSLLKSLEVSMMSDELDSSSPKLFSKPWDCQGAELAELVTIRRSCEREGQRAAR